MPTAISAGQQVDFAVWPDYVNREEFWEALVEYADEAVELCSMAGAVTPRSREDERLRFEVFSISDSVFSVAAGSPGTGVELDRQQYTIKRTELGKALARVRGSGSAPADPGSRG
ncbi:hypothetical protein IU479_02265 [Nocardia abscessus]|uniref:hypothetical protein n=1 Tax=Nocardia TaxID=1817 RepID=UPI0018963430|nr:MULTISPECIES: hypothetical protein [Nocardia]MBF6216934.1 hypothetical protein [Nocardia abscessus]